MPRITDFGIGGAATTAALEEATGLTEFTVRVPTMLKSAGTPPHASPQQLEGNDPDPRDDVYARGVMAYQMFTGELNAPGADARDKLEEMNAPDGLIRLIVKSVSDPARRPKDAVEWAEALASLLPHRADGAPPEPVVLKRSVTVPGVWFSVPGGADPGAEWERVGFSPREIAFAPDREYRLVVHEGVADEDLEGLRALADVSPFSALVVGECRGLSPTGLAPLAGLTNLRALRLDGNPSTPAGLAHVAGLTGLRELSLGHTSITDAGLRHVTRLTELRTLSLNPDEVTDEGLAPLAALTNLRTLRLSNCPLTTDTGLVHLAGLRELRVLHLYNAVRVTDAGLAHLAGLTRLQELHLPASSVAGPGLDDLAPLADLHTLFLAGCPALTDAGLAHLTSLPALRSLTLLSCSGLTDAGVPHLAQLTALERLSVKGSGITSSGLAALKAALPRCGIAH